MGLSGQQRKELQEALMDAFPDEASLEQMLSLELDKNLYIIASGANLSQIVFELIKKAEAENWVEDLVIAARRANSGNKRLKDIAESLGIASVVEKTTDHYQSQLQAGKPFQAPPLPTYYVNRPEYSQDLKTRLLTNSSDVRTLVVTGIHGLGSVGKSTLAAALAHDEEVQAHFYDGILWATLGQQPNLLSLLSAWVQALGDYNFKATSVEATSLQLRTLLHEKAVLLVVDDAWNPSDAQAFNVAGVRCQVIVTTRESAVTDVLGAGIYSLDVMKPSQAIELLTKKLGHKIIGAELVQAEILAKEIGYLPLALELAASQVASGIGWEELLKDIQGEIVRLKTFDRPGTKDTTDEASLKRLSLTASLNLSIQRLEQQQREDFIWLGILPEDVNLTQKMAVTLWDMDDERDARDELLEFQSKALLLPDVPLLDGTPTYRLHDLFHDLARNLLTTPPKPKRGNLPGLGITLSAAHATFLEKYRNLTDKNLWHTLPYDGYIHQHLVWHLEKAQKVEEIHQLLAEESENGGNGWYEACVHLGQTANFVTDVSRAWELAEDSWTKTTLPQIIGWQCRYALIIASLNSLTANLPIKLLIALLKKNIWTPEQGFAYVLQSSNLLKKVELLTELADYLPQNLKELALSKALAGAREIQDNSSRARALISLAPKLPELLPDAFAAAREIQDNILESGVRGLSFLADKLPSELLPNALAAFREIQDNESRTLVLISLAPKLPELLPDAFAAAREIQDDRYRALALSFLADKLPSELLPNALAVVREIQDDSNRITALYCLADKLPSELLPDALAVVREIQDNESRAHTLISLADKLPELLPDAFAAAREIQDNLSRAHALSSLVDKLPSELLPNALAAVREIQDDRYRAHALYSLADKLPELLPDALAVARKIQDNLSRAHALSSLVDKLPELLPDALAAVREIQDDRYRAHALSSLVDKLPELLPDALAAVREIQDNKSRAHALSSLVDKLPSKLLPDALAVARKIQDNESRADALNSLADKLPELLPDALVAVREIQDNSSRARFLSSLVDKLPELLPDALAAVRKIQDNSSRARFLSSLVDKLPELLPDALAAVREIQDNEIRADALGFLAHKLPSELLPDALAAVREIQDNSSRARFLSSLVDKLPSELLPDALAAAREIQDNSSRADALGFLAHMSINLVLVVVNRLFVGG